MKFGSLDHGTNGEHSGVDFVKITEILAIQDKIFFKMKPEIRTTITLSININVCVHTYNLFGSLTRMHPLRMLHFNFLTHESGNITRQHHL